MGVAVGSGGAQCKAAGERRSKPRGAGGRSMRLLAGACRQGRR
ncbi:hypothetical protein BURMUCF1_3193 [Burkholderia multivorans ATCC BAA-247]|uniref:Uncharacterized protein n=1 Tax=Burkholderia multivorans CGD2 TaxID=513052 RepID=B9BW72_9BURK|nr:hypothetical protein BURMUCGD2_3401 [Burkholderia multivorans CGD2]EEE10720.1 hypothetical protein BURMUCGD2M_3394 [Burkholderia multivorans CGD2M]EJO56615.1 hypothetical protein BURMUCF1_3193 [Burkholderia multivorans ATCC BAA-247]